MQHTFVRASAISTSLVILRSWHERLPSAVELRDAAPPKVIVFETLPRVKSPFDSLFHSSSGRGLLGMGWLTNICWMRRRRLSTSGELRKEVNTKVGEWSN